MRLDRDAVRLQPAVAAAFADLRVDVHALRRRCDLAALAQPASLGCARLVVIITETPFHSAARAAVRAGRRDGETSRSGTAAQRVLARSSLTIAILRTPSGGLGARRARVISPALLASIGWPPVIPIARSAGSCSDVDVRRDAGPDRSVAEWKYVLSPRFWKTCGRSTNGARRSRRRLHRPFDSRRACRAPASARPCRGNRCLPARSSLRPCRRIVWTPCAAERTATGADLDRGREFRAAAAWNASRGVFEREVTRRDRFEHAVRIQLAVDETSDPRGRRACRRAAAGDRRQVVEHARELILDHTALLLEHQQLVALGGERCDR